jgi:outer membrane protein assembly factor BamB
MEQFSNTSPAINAGVVVVGSNGGHYYAFDVLSGGLRWHYVADGTVHLTAPIILGERVFMAGGNDSDRVHSVSVATGAAAPGWPIKLPAAEPDIPGVRVGRHRAVSSFSAAGGLLLLQTRLDDALDTDADGVVDTYLSRETVVALSPADGTVVWQHPLARAERSDHNDVPKFFVCPTPAAFGTVSGAPLAAVASSLEALVVVLDVASGAERTRHAVAGAALGSPVVANGRLYATAMNGTVEGLLSSVNHPPAAPIAAANPLPLDQADVRLRWLAALDADGDLASYQLRIDSDGEVLESWQHEALLGVGVTSTRVMASLASLAPGVTYTFAVRARDQDGAYSPWSAPETFQVTANPAVVVGGTPAASLAAALGAAQPGDVIVLGEGTYTLSETLHVGAGVSMRGAGAGRTTLNASGLAVGVSFTGVAGGHAAGLDGVTVAGADTCVQVGAESTGIRLSHLIARDCRIDGVAVAATGQAEVVNATLVGNGTGLHAAGVAKVRNSLLTANGIALACETSGSLAGTYNDLFANQVDRSATTTGAGDFSSVVTFADLPARDLHLREAQPSTDRGDPSDPVGAEPAPSGARINLGAFGGTADAEQSATSTAVGGAIPSAQPTAPAPTRPPRPALPHERSGCAVASPAGADWAAVAMLALLVLAGARRQRRGRPHPPDAGGWMK